MEIIVRAFGSGSDFPKEALLTNLPSDGSFSRSIDSNDVLGNNLVDSTGGQFTKNYGGDQIIVADDSNVWSAGSTIQFRINSGEANFKDLNADRLEVTIVHTPSNSVLKENTFS